MTSSHSFIRSLRDSSSCLALGQMESYRLVLSFLLDIVCQSSGRLLLGWFVASCWCSRCEFSCLVWPSGFPFVQNDPHSTMIRHDPCRGNGVCPPAQEGQRTDQERWLKVAPENCVREILKGSSPRHGPYQHSNEVSQQGVKHQDRKRPMKVTLETSDSHQHSS